MWNISPQETRNPGHKFTVDVVITVLSECRTQERIAGEFASQWLCRPPCGKSTRTSGCRSSLGMLTPPRWRPGIPACSAMPCACRKFKAAAHRAVVSPRRPTGGQAEMRGGRAVPARSMPCARPVDDRSDRARTNGAAVGHHRLIAHSLNIHILRLSHENLPAPRRIACNACRPPSG